MKEKLLLVSPIAPFPKTSGGAIRICNTIAQLKTQFELHVVFLLSSSYQLSSDEITWLDQNTSSWVRVPLSKRILFSYWRYGVPYWFSDCYCPSLVATMLEIIRRHQITKVQIEFSQLLYLQQHLPKSINSVFVAHDISTISFWRRLQETKNPLKLVRNYWRWLAIRGYEAKYLPQFKTVIAMSDTDRQELIKTWHLPKVVTIPNGIEEINFLPAPQSAQINLGHIGGFTHSPNLQAVKFFITQVAPLLEQQRVDYSYYLAGDHNRALIQQWIQQARLKSQRRIIDLGTVANIQDFYRQVDVLVVTLHSGSGTRIKILEALGYGRNVISTKVGVEGIDPQTWQIEVAESPAQFVAAIKTFAKNQGKPNQEHLIQLTWQHIFANYQERVFGSS